MKNKHSAFFSVDLFLEPKKSDHIGKWSGKHWPIHFQCSLCKHKIISSLCIHLSVVGYLFRRNLNVQCHYLHANVTLRRASNEWDGDAQQEKEESWEKQRINVCTQTTINYLVISLQAANKFNQHKGLAASSFHSTSIESGVLAGYFLITYVRFKCF